VQHVVAGAWVRLRHAKANTRRRGQLLVGSFSSFNVPRNTARGFAVLFHFLPKPLAHGPVGFALRVCNRRCLALTAAPDIIEQSDDPQLFRPAEFTEPGAITFENFVGFGFLLCVFAPNNVSEAHE